MKSKTINIRIEKTLLDYLEVAARSHGVSRSGLLRRVLTDYINSFRDLTDYEYDDVLG